jgi:thiosulfate/3-mercaptopyruvate sulfurtransferase
VPPGFAYPEWVVDTAWLAQHLNDPDLRIIDVRAADKYREGHIPGAVNLVPAEFTTKAGDITNELPQPERFAQLAGSIGVGDKTRVVIYDAGDNLWASRLWWTLDFFGYGGAALLNGGIAAWQADGREVTSKAPVVAKATFTPRPDASKLATKQQVEDAIKAGAAVFCDARSPAEYAGTDVRAKRGGRIPTAKNADWGTTLTKTAAGVPTFKSGQEIAKLYSDGGLEKGREVITYCQSGVRAAHAYFTLKLVGYGKVRNYDGSWEEWGNDPNTPVEK